MFDSTTVERLEGAAARYRELERQVSQPEIASRPNQLRELMQEMAALRPTVETYAQLRERGRALEENRALLDDADPDIRALAQEEIPDQEAELERLELELRKLLLPRDPNDSKNVVLEIRAGTGGEEAALFAADLLRMYTRYAERCGLQVELLSLSEAAAGGVREVIATLSGPEAYARLKHESGVHRVQRVPATESQGRIHTSTATVAALPEAEEVDIQIDEERELRIDVYRSSGPGGQSVNTTDSAVRITHLPSGMVVTCQDEKSQHKNRAKALRILRSRLYDREQERLADERADARRGQIGSGGRSERVRTYNFAQNRVTDHRIGLTLHKLEQVLEGELDELIEALALAAQSQALAAGASG